MLSQNKKILIIEDDSFLGNMLSNELRREGFDVILIQDGADGLAAIYSEKPNLVLLDTILPTVSGHEILEKKYVDSMISDIPVIIISNSEQTTEIERALALGACDHLVKDRLDPKEALRKVRACFSGKSPHANATASTNTHVVGALSGKKILLVEDDAFIKDILVRKLSIEGCTSLNAHNGEEAMRILGEQVPDIILLDLILPGMSGFDVLEKIQDDPRLSKVPIITFSNLGQDNEIARAKRLGARLHIVKAEMSVGDVMNEIVRILENNIKYK